MSTTYSTNEQNTPKSSGYRIKFRKEEFLMVLSEAHPKRVYRVKNFYYFAYDGFVMYTEDIEESDIAGYRIIDAIEFSNYPWTKR